MFDEFEVGHKSHIPEPDLVPILDALTSLIFFLLLSTTFIELTKLTLPPSKTEIVTSSPSAPPVAGKIYMKIEDSQRVSVIVKWSGSNPDQIKRTILRGDLDKPSLELGTVASQLTSRFKEMFPNEHSVQLALSEGATYQEMITIMDGIRDSINDIVLTSHSEIQNL